ncbi:MAG: bifunctional diaminohydroxyphosphoribosylaminopyrimidine deaminase/5-amino-6-(5-phosphoribosylamino)uracil reductase RibD [Bacteroidota bacterium]|nr:bifunctional diaminohydroxyphosphoribosylaminopyrimidine deaminase/5-amino-6-(5-phosphoribosylamino)uracil reductase RibD [Bacteroidota bacterium]
MTKDEHYMSRCLELAKKSQGHTAPNPMVGSVIVHEGKIIGEGRHQKYGKPHAEVNAVNSVQDKSLLANSVLYVNLEPCAHVGKTPACSVMIIEHKIPKVVIGCSDSYKEVDGKGIQMLRDAGTEVVVGVLEEESRVLNARFFTFHEKKRPYIILKWAQTSDGFIDFERTPDTPIGPNWISDKYAQIKVHKWRAQEDAILVGTNTAEKDNPKLNVRLWKGKNPLRVLMDRQLRLRTNLSLLDKSIETIVFTEKKSSKVPGLEFIFVDKNQGVFDVMMKTLYEREIQSLIIEGGAQLLRSVIERGLWDEARVFVGDALFLSGIKAPKINKQPEFIERRPQNSLYYYKK